MMTEFSITDIEGAIQFAIANYSRMKDCAHEIKLSDDPEYIKQIADNMEKILGSCEEMFEMIYYYNYTLKRKKMDEALNGYMKDESDND